MARDYFDESKKKKKKETTQVQKVAKSPSVKNVNKTASKSTFMGGGSAVKKTEKAVSRSTTNRSQSFSSNNQPVKRQPTARTNSARLTAAQTQKTYGTTRPNLKTAEEMRKEREAKRKQSEAKRKQMQLKKSGLAPEDQPTAAQKAAVDRAIKNTPGLIKKAGLDAASGYGQTLTDFIARTASSERGTEAKAMKMGIEKGTQQYRELEEERKRTAEEARKDNRSLYEKMKSRQAEWDEKTKDAKGLEKAYYGAVESGTGMIADTAIGALTGTGQVGALASMGLRTYGSSANQARAEGATDAEAGWYGLAQAAKEMGTEAIGGGGLAKVAYGKGALGLGDIATNTLIRNLKGQKADLANMGVRLLGDVAEENIEEFAGWTLDPWIKELTYGRNVRGRDAQTAMRDKSNALRAEIQNDDDARAAAAYLSSDDFLQQTMQDYIASGLKEKDAAEVAERMRDYLTASLTGDTDSMQKIEDEVSRKVAKSHNVFKDYSFKELKETFEATSLLVAATGLPANISTMNRGNLVKEQLGDEGVRALANTAIDFEDSTMSTKAEAMKARLDSGKELTGTQTYELMSGMQEQVRKDTEREQSSRRMAAKAIESDNLLTPYRQNENGGIDLDAFTEAAYRESANKAGAAIDAFTKESKQSITDTEKADGSKAIAGFQTGVFTVDDANALNYSNTTVRAAFENVTGVNLGQYIVRNKKGEVDIPATNTKTKDALFAMAADNLVKSAQAETKNWMDVAKGEVVTQVSARMGARGSEALQMALDDVDERDRSKYMMTANATDMLYQAARNMGTEWESISNEATRMFPGISETKLKAMYEAGLEDRQMANDKMRGRQIRMGKALSEMGEQETSTGKVFIDTEVPPKGTVIRTFTEIAKNLGADIHFVDYIYDNNNDPIKGANGSYDPKTNTFYLNVSTGVEKNIGYIFMHETTHYLKRFAPEQYQALENLVRERWFAFNPSQMQDAIANKIEAYKRVTKGQQVLTEEEALEEIIADASHDFINDPEFAKQVAEEDMGLAKAVLDSIRNALRMLRSIFASGTIDDETHMNSLFRELDILTEAERLWLDAYKVAVQNSSIAAVNEWQDNANKQSEQRLSVSEAYDDAQNTTYSLSDAPSMEELDGSNSILESDNGEPVAKFDEDGAVRFSISSYEAEGRKVYKNYLDKLVNDGELSQKEADDMLRELETIYGISKNLADSGKYAPFTAWSEATVIRDSKGKPVFSAIKKNSEYKMNIDFSTICKKRRTLDAVFREMINRGLFEQLDLNKDESAALVVNINNLIRQHKFEAACALCFVEARRYRQQQTAKTFTDMWNGLVESMYKDKSKIAYFNFGEDSTVEDVADGIHTMDDVDLDLTYIKKVANAKKNGKPVQTAEAKAARLILNDPEQRKLMRVGDMMASTGFENMQVNNPELMKVYNSKKGTGGAKSSFGDVQYLNEIIRSKTFSRLKAYDVSGVRIQSFSDYVPRMVFDYVQVIADLAAKKLPAHAYTKEVLFAKQFGLTGAKINLSLVPDVVADSDIPGLDKDGNYVWNEEGTFPYDEAMELQKAEGYKDNCGTIAVGISDEQIWKMLADPTIQMVIPYHKSSLNPIVAAMTNVDRFTDYTDFQNTKDAEGKTVKKDFAWDRKLFRLTHDAKGNLLPKEKWGNVQDLVKEYAEWCESKNYTPKFSKFLYMEDGSINPGYYKLLEDFALLDNDGNFKPQGDVQMRFPTSESAFGSMEDLIKQGLSEDTALEAKRSEEISGIVDEIEGMMQEGTLTEQSATSEKLAQRLSVSDTDTNGNSLTDEQIEFFKNSQAVDAEGRLLTLYHGTSSAGFNTFRPGLIWLTTSRRDADSYGGNWEHKIYDPEEREQRVPAFGGSYRLDNPFFENFRFDTEEDMQNFIATHPDIDRIKSDDELFDMLEEGEIDEDDYDRLNRLADKYEADYRRYELNRFGNFTWGDLMDNPERFTKDDFFRALLVWDKEISAEDIEDVEIEDLLATMQEEEDLHQAEGMTMRDMMFRTRIPEGETGEYVYPVNQRSYEVYANLMNPLIVDLHGDGIEGNYGYVNEMLEGDYDGLILRNCRVGRYHDIGDVAIAKESSQVKLTSNENPTSDPDIRYSLNSDGEELTEGQADYFANSQARDIFGRLVPVYHATDMGGFTIFDPMRSDDHRSLFFSNRRDVAKTYAYNGGNAFDFAPKELNNWNDLIQYGRQLFSDADMSWDDDTDDINLDFELYDKQTGDWADIDYDEWLDLANSNDPHANDYRVRISLPYNNKDGETETISFEGDSMSDLLSNVANGNIPHGGHYQVYLNLENPLIIEGHGQAWNDIVDGGATFPSYSYVTLKKASWFREEAERRDEMYGLGQSLYNGDKDRARADEFENDDFVEIEIFDGQKKIKNIIPIDEEVIADELAAAFGIDDIEIVEGIANELAGDMSWQNFSKFYGDDMRNTIGEYGYDTREWAEFAEDEGYDGVIIRNIVDIDNKTDIFDSDEEAISDIYIAFSSNQVKDINNENPTENPDIRYSVTEDEAMSHAAHDYAYDNSYEALAYYEQYIEQMSEDDLNDGFIGHPMQRLMDRLSKYGETDEAARRGRNKYKYRQTYKIDNEEEFMNEFYAGLTRYADGMKFDDPVLEEGRTRMAKSRQDFFNSNITKWNQTWVTDGEVLKIESIRKPVRDLVMNIMSESNTNKKYKSDLVKTTLMNMRFAYMYAQRGRTDIADALLWHTALRMIDGVEFYEEDGNFETYKKLRDFFKNTNISLGEEYWSDTDYAAFRKTNYGRLNLVRGKTNVDKVLGELYEVKEDGTLGGIAPEWFSPEAFENNNLKFDSVPDQLLQMAAVLDTVEPYAKAYSSEYCAEWATDIASSLLDIMQNQGEALVSKSDRYEAKIKAMKARHAEAMLKVRQQRDEGIKREKIRFKEYVEKKKEQQAHSKLFDRIVKTHKKLTDRLTSNTADSNIPEQYKKELARLLAAFDLQTVGSKKYEARTGRQGKKSIKLAEIKAVLNNIESNSGEFFVNDAITDIIDDLLGKDIGNGHNRSIEGLTIDELNSSELARIDKLLRALLHEFNTYRNVKIGVKRQQVADIGHAQNTSALEHAKIFGSGKDYRGILGVIDKIINMDELTPSYLFRRIDPNKEGMWLMYEQLEDSHDRYIRNTQQLTKWVEEIVGEYHHNGIISKSAGVLDDWRSENYSQTFKLESGETISLTPAQMMSIYCLNNRAQAKSHMLNGGVVIAPVSYNANILSDLKKRANTALPKTLTDADISKIITSLSDEQINVAQKLQKLMAEKMAAWGNEASMNVLGIELFGEPDYFPIKSDKAGLISDLSEDQFVEAIRSFGFTKAVKPGAGNAIMVNDIFDVVVEHCNNMNLYNAYSEAINDFMKVFNYKEKREEGTYTVKQAIAHAYSQKATSYIMSFMKDLNGNVSGGKNTGINDAFNMFLANAKKASVFANIRVAAQQPTAIGRVFQVLDPKYAAAMTKPEKGVLKEMFDHCPIALWKSWGYYDINMGRNIEDVIMNNNNFIEDVATKAYGELDNMTWGGIWQMVKAETEDKHSDVKKGSDEYWDLCNRRMREVVAFTQVVDSPFHRSHAMRSKNFMDKLATAFGAEPTLTFNMVRDGYVRAVEMWKTGDKAGATKLLTRTITVFGFSAALTAAAAALPDVLRGKDPGADDDEDGERTVFERWWANTLANFKDNINLLNNIYYVKDVKSILEGWEINNLGLQGWKYLGTAMQQLTGSKFVRSKDPWWKNFLYGMGYLTGVPVKTMLTDFGAMFNKAKDIIGFETPILDAVLEQMDGMAGGSDSSNSSSASKASGSGSKKAKSSGFMIPGVEDGSAFDNFLNARGINLTPEEREARAFAARAAAISKKYEDLTGEERDKKIWSTVTSDAKEDNEGRSFADMIAEADYGTIREYKRLYLKAGGNAEYFDERVFDMSKKAMKKTIKYDQTEKEISQQDTIKEYLLTHGMTEDELSDIVYKSDTAKDMKVAFRLNDKQLMLETLAPLVHAGLTYEDLERLWDNRNRMQLSSYKGRYKDKLKSTGTFIWPTNGTITSYFGYRNAPTAGASSNHPAIDIGAPMGSDVVAADGGVVIYVGQNGGYGKSVGIKHDNGMVTYYNHLSSWDVNEGDTVAQGQHIANVGSTGISTGPHLDFKVLDPSGEPVDPLKYLENKRS